MTRRRLAASGAALIAAVGLAAAASGVVSGPWSPTMPMAWTGGGMGRGGPAMGGMFGVVDPADVMFARMMIPHHEAAVEMANLALERAKRREVRALAASIIRTQTAEIVQLRGAAARLSGDESAPAGPEMRAGMGPGMGFDLGSDLSQVPRDGDFDRAFLEAMIPHHRMGVQMSEMVLQRGSDAEVQGLAAGMVKVQTAEIGQMQEWLNQWYSA